MTIEKLTPIQYKIVEQIIEAIDILGGKNDCTTPLCSWGDTLPEKDVLQMLTEWNERSRLKSNLNVDHVDAGARARMVLERVKLAVAHGNVLEGREREATPVVFVVVRDSAFAAVSGELIEQGLLDSGLVANGVRTHLADESVVVGDYLLLLEDGVADRVVCGGGHSDVSEKETGANGPNDQRSARNSAPETP